MESHVRIDEGVKRGPRKLKKDGTPDMRTVPTGGQPARYQHNTEQQIVRRGRPMPQDANPHELLQEYVETGSTAFIADRLGVARQTVTRFLREHLPDEWRKVQIVKALVTKETSEEEIASAADALTLARARELLRSGQWDLERLDSANYGQKQEVTHTVSIVASLERIAEIEGQASRVADQQQEAVQQLSDNAPGA